MIKEQFTSDLNEIQRAALLDLADNSGELKITKLELMSFFRVFLKY
jgi:hypothetical protein